VDMADSNQTLGPEPTAHLLAEAERRARRLDAAAVEKLDRIALLSFLSGLGVPPAPWPAWIELTPDLRADLWMRVMASAPKGWAALAVLALQDLAPDGERSEPALEIARRGIETARARGGSPLEWQALVKHSACLELSPLVSEWARANVTRMRGDWETAYIVLGDDPGGSALARANIPSPIVGRIVTRMCEALRGPQGEIARVWLDALAISPLRDAVPMEIKLELSAAAGDAWAPLARLRQAYEGTSSSHEPAPVEQQPFLERELVLLAQRAPGGTPDLASLSAQLGGALPESTVRTLDKWMKPRVDEAGTRPRLMAGLTGMAAMAREQTSKLREQTSKLKEHTSKLKEHTSKLKEAWPKPKPKTKPDLEPPPPAAEPEALPAEPPAVIAFERTALQKSLLEWIRGGSAAEDRHADGK